MDHFQHVYASQAARYHEMIAAEDVDANLPAALRAAAPMRGKRILDLGTGTGRLPLLLAREAALMVGLDLYADMLNENAAQRARSGGAWKLVQGDMRALPFPAACAEVVTAGWAIGHLRGWFDADWQEQIGRVLREMHRVAAPGGSILILETLTTGALTPAPPSQALAEYYAWLEVRWGFSRQAVRTDYQFQTVEAAVAQTEFFFGEELSAEIRRQGWARLPEWTGLWAKQV
jgi:ubiquinone/menaquinone biosynthesis C-methylase UbiE